MNLIFHQILFAACTIVSVTCNEELEVSISQGVIVEDVPGVIMYTEQQALNFFIPDLPDLPLLTSSHCPQRPYTEACAINSKLIDINQDSLMLLTLLNAMLTKKGLDTSFGEDVPVSDVPITNQRSSGKGEPPTSTFIEAAGLDWYKSLRERLDQRKLHMNDDNLLTRNTRSPGVLSFVAKGAAGVATLLGLDDLFGYVSRLFVSKDQILSLMTALKAYMPIDRKAFAEVIKRASEYETFSKKKFAEIVEDNQDLRNLTNSIQDEVKFHRLDISVIQESFAYLQRLLADISTLLFTALVYIVQINAFQVCCSKELPLLYVPPDLLSTTLSELEGNLASDIEFAIPIQKASMYYKLDGLTTCIMDDDGGTVRLMIPLRTKGAAFQLFKDKTCVLEMDASYVVKEKKSNFVYPVSALDAITCDPDNQRICLVPPSTMDDLTSSCVSIILSGGTTEELKSGCRKSCSMHSTPEIAKIADSTFIGTHIRPNSLSIQCPSENLTVTQSVEYGALKIITPCSCTLHLDGRIIGRSTKVLCSSQDVLTVEAILPAHFIGASDIIHFGLEGKESPRYKHKDEIFNPHFLEETHPDETDSVITTKLNVYSVTWNAMQSLLLAYSFFKIHTLGTLLFQLTQGIPMVQASSSHTCKLPQEIYTILIAILVISILSIIPQMIFFMCNVCRNAFWQTVEIEAKRLQLEENDKNVKAECQVVANNMKRQRSDSLDSIFETRF